MPFLAVSDKELKKKKLNSKKKEYCYSTAKSSSPAAPTQMFTLIAQVQPKYMDLK